MNVRVKASARFPTHATHCSSPRPHTNQVVTRDSRAVTRLIWNFKSQRRQPKNEKGRAETLDSYSVINLQRRPVKRILNMGSFSCTINPHDLKATMALFTSKHSMHFYIMHSFLCWCFRGLFQFRNKIKYNTIVYRHLRVSLWTKGLQPVRIPHPRLAWLVSQEQSQG